MHVRSESNPNFSGRSRHILSRYSCNTPSYNECEWDHVSYGGDHMTSHESPWLDETGGSETVHTECQGEPVSVSVCVCVCVCI